MQMKDEIFRKKSLDKVKSPESLDDYIRLSNPGVWLLLVSVIVLLAGACVWGIFGHIDRTVDTNIFSHDGTAVCYVSEKDISAVKPDMTVKGENYEAVIDSIGGKTEWGYVCLLHSDQKLPDGLYDGEIITNKIRPLSFILN